MAEEAEKIKDHDVPDFARQSSTTSSATRVNDSASDRAKGKWGEQDDGEGVNVTTALKEYRQFSTRGTQFDEEALDTTHEKFSLEQWIKHRKSVYNRDSVPWEKRLGVIFKDLSVQGVSSDAAFNKDLGRAVIGTFGPDLFNFLAKRLPSIAKLIPGQRVQVRNLIEGFTGSLKDEMLLVLGRPGSGCSTFLRAIANERSGFVSVGGDVSYGGLSAERAAKEFRGETIYMAEDDLHFPTLTVEQTLTFALANKAPNHRPHGESKSDYVQLATNLLLRMFGISHTRHTVVGDAMVRGVSGGERKRVSIAESVVAGGALTSWDNSTRGLDSSTALDYVRSVRILTDIIGRTNVVSLYQASENIYELFDKVMLIDEGRMVFFGSTSDARSYFEELGYCAAERETTPDFLTSLTDPTQRRVRDDALEKAPRTASEREAAFRRSPLYQKVLDDIAEFEEEVKDGRRIEQIKSVTRELKSRSLGKKSPYTVSGWTSVKSLVHRQFLLKWADRGGIYTKTATNIVVSFVVGSMFWNSSNSASTAFSYGGALFLSLIFLGWLNLGELYEAVQGRAITARHQSFALYRPSMVTLAQILVDVPLNLLQVTLFTIIYYWLAQLERSASAFFIFYLFVFLTTTSMTCFFRAVAALSATFDAAIRFSVIGLNIAIVFVGYVIPREDMPSALFWISWVHPLSYAFEALMANQFARVTLTCDGDYIVPQVPGAQEQFQSCYLQGSVPGSLTISGSDYIQQSFGYSYGNVWRDFGILIAYIVAYVIAAALFSELFSFANTGGASTIFIRTKHAKERVKESTQADRDDEERVMEKTRAMEKSRSGVASDEDCEKVDGMQPSEAIFTFKDICYSVDTPDGERQLLDKVSGWVRPGESTALMGSSGAGKTTLLNTLSLRMDPTRVTGDILVDGKEPPISFARSCGFAEQQDVHESAATVREALEFAALLRQSRDIPREQKLAYVNTILDLLDLTSLQDALIGTPEAGLTVEQRKRVTIGVELAAKPTILTYMDEPTSGLDSNSAISIGKFIRRLAKSGQGCLATIHQPSSVLLTTYFDRLLLLSPGGHVTYFGPVSEATKYFEKNGARTCEPDENIAEYVLEVVGQKREPSWGEMWMQSKERQEVQDEIDKVCKERQGQEHHFADDREYAAPIWEQTRLLSIRVAKAYWRDPSYGYGKIAATFLVAFFSAFTFYQLPNTIASMQQRMFAIFLVILVLPALMNASIPKHFIVKGLWQARERYSKTYGWEALVTALLVNEIPYALFCAVLYFVLFYFPVGFPTGQPAGLVFIDTVLIMLFVPSFIHWLCSLAVSPSFVANMLPLALLSDHRARIIVPYGLMPPPWRPWLYYNNPLVYFLSSELGGVLHNIPIICSEQELATFNPPAGQTCGAYALAAIQVAGGSLINPDATSNCQSCQYTVADQYLSSLNIEYGDRWRDFGIFLVFTGVNFALCYFIFYFWQIKGLVFFFNGVWKRFTGGFARWTRPWNLKSKN